MHHKRILVIVMILATALALLTVSLALAQESAVIRHGAAEPTQSSIILTKTVGTDPNLCASSDSITVLAETSVTQEYNREYSHMDGVQSRTGRRGDCH